MASRSPRPTPTWASRGLPTLPGMRLPERPTDGPAEATTEGPAAGAAAGAAEAPAAPRAAPAKAARPPALTVGALTAQIKQTLAAGFSGARVQGELSQLSRPASGHWYFTLCDAEATLDCVMFRGAVAAVGFVPEPGQRVEVVGDIDVYAPRGRYNLVCKRLVRAGEGDRKAELEALKRRLAADGLLDPARKRPLPRYPRVVGLATSASGAALQDLRRVLHQRAPGLTLIVAPCAVQGIDAPREIVRALRMLAEDGRAEVIIVGRGGGSAEDLAAFDDEGVARAIAACPVPVVSAVGHEVDVTIADLVADLRAATPSHAAELVAPEEAALRALVLERGHQLQAAAAGRIARGRRAVAALRVPTPALLVARAHARLDGQRARLLSRGAQLLPQRAAALGLRSRRLAAAGAALLPRRAIRAQALQRRLGALGAALVPERRARLETLGARLLALDPRAVLDRGYALVLQGGAVMLDANAAEVGSTLEVVLRDGALRVRVEAVLPRP